MQPCPLVDEGYKFITYMLVNFIVTRIPYETSLLELARVGASRLQAYWSWTRASLPLMNVLS